VPMTSAGQLVRAWETGTALSPPARGIELLSALEPETSKSMAASLSLGERDHRLLRLRRDLFGPVLDATVACPHCGQRVELAVDVESLLVQPIAAPARSTIDVDGLCVEFRLPRSSDLLELASSPSGLTATSLIRRCITSVLRDGADASSIALSEAVCAAVSSRMAELDPQADLQLSISCPSCQQPWSSDLDVVGYFWAELTSGVRRLLADVHRLASAYGWREGDILAMSSQRRAAYLELIDA
jgi:hypothetical protein